MNRHYLNSTGFYKLAQSIKDYINRKITGYDKLGTASTKDFTTYVSPTQTEQLPISSSVYSAMTNMLRGAYHPAGSKTVAELTSDLLVKANLGNVYKITEDGVTSDLFIGGAGQTIKTGDNAVVLYASEDTYKFALESGVVDLDAYQKKELTTAIEGTNTVEGALGALSSGKVSTDLVLSDASASNKLVTEKDALIYYQSNSSSIADFNNAVPQTSKGAIQMFYLGSDIANAPIPNGGGFIVVAEQLSTTYISQLATQIGTNAKYTRSKAAGAWSSWQKLVTESDLNTYAKPHIYELSGGQYATLQTFFDELITRLKSDAVGNNYGICFMGTWTGKTFFEGSFYTVDGRSSYIKVTFQNPQDSKSLYTGYTGYSDTQVTYTGVA